MLYTVLNEEDLRSLQNLCNKFTSDFQRKISKMECMSGVDTIVINSTYLNESLIAYLPKLDNMKIKDIQLEERTLENKAKLNILTIRASINETTEKEDIFNTKHFRFMYYLKDTHQFKTEFI